MYNPNVSTIGIMFDSLPKSDREFPTLEEVGYNWAGEWTDPAYVGDLAYWLVVAHDPSRVGYFDDDAEAMDETNFDAFMSDFVAHDAPDDVDTYDPADDDAEADEQGRRPIYGYGKVMLVRPDDERAIALAVETRNALSGYPLLDESTYCEREWNAWQDYVMGDLRYDVKRDIAGWFGDDDDAADMTVDAIDDAWDEIAYRANDHIHYSQGFTGEHSPDFSECVAHAIGDALVGLARLAFA